MRVESMPPPAVEVRKCMSCRGNIIKHPTYPALWAHNASSGMYMTLHPISNTATADTMFPQLATYTGDRAQPMPK